MKTKDSDFVRDLVERLYCKSHKITSNRRGLHINYQK